jgi:hypothetical protein
LYAARSATSSTPLASIAALSVYVQEGRSDQALPIYDQELAVYRRDPNRFAEEIAAVSNHRGIVDQTRWQQTGDPAAYEAALAEFDVDLKTDERLFGPADPRTIAALGNRGVLLGLAD